MNKSYDDSLSKRGIISLVFLTIIAGVMRFYGLEVSSLWNDELGSLLICSYPTAKDVIFHSSIEGTFPPGYFLLMFVLKHAFGNSETVFRLPSAIAGTLTVPLVALIGRRYYGIGVGLAAGAFMAFFRAPIDISQEAYAYMILVFFITLSMFAWDHVFQHLHSSKPTRLLWTVLLITSAICACYTHNIGLVFIGLQSMVTLVLLMRKPRLQLKAGLIYLPVLAAYLPMLPLFLKQLSSPIVTNTISWIPPPSLLEIAKIPVNAFNRSLSLITLVSVICIGTLCTVLFRAWKRKDLSGLFKKPRWGDWVLSGWILIPFATILLFSIVRIPILHYRPMLFLLPPIYLLLARGIFILTRDKRLRYGITVALVTISLVDLLFISRYYTTGQREQFREAAAFVINHTQEANKIALIASAHSPYYFDYYFERLDSPTRVDVFFNPRRTKAIELESLIIRLQRERGAKQVWLIAGHIIPEDEHHEVFRKLGYKLQESQILFKAGAWLYVLE